MSTTRKSTLQPTKVEQIGKYLRRIWFPLDQSWHYYEDLPVMERLHEQWTVYGDGLPIISWMYPDRANAFGLDLYDPTWEFIRTTDA